MRNWKKRSGYLSYGKKIVKIGPVEAEIYSVDLKKEEILEGKFAERAKKIKIVKTFKKVTE